MSQKVSIIIPVFNAENYISETIQSLLNQSYENIEIILVDDGSTDGSSKIIDNNIDARIKYYHQENKGAPAARNYGFEKAEGELVIFFDADDTLTQNGIYKVVEMFNANQTIDMVIGDFSSVDDNSELILESNLGSIKERYYIAENLQEKYKIIANSNPFPGNKIYKKSFLDSNQIIFHDLKIAQDLNFLLEVLAHEPNIEIYGEIICLYRIHNNSISTNVTYTIAEVIKSIDLIDQKKYELYMSNPSILESVKYNHYSVQLYKIPMIKERAERYSTFKKLKLALEDVKIQYVDFDLISISSKKIKLAVNYPLLYTSNFFSYIFHLFVK